MFQKENIWQYIIIGLVAVISFLASMYLSPWVFFGLTGLLLLVLFGFKIISNDKHMLVCILLSILPGMLGRYTTEDRGGAAILLTDVLVLLFVFIWAFKTLVGRKELVKHLLLSLLFIFAGILLLSWIQGIYIVDSTGEIDFKGLIVSFLYLCRFFFYAAIPLMTLGTLKKDIDLKKWVKIFSWIFFGVIIGGFMQRIFWPDFFMFFVKYGWDPHQDRLLGSFFDPNFIGAFLSMNILFFLSITLHSKECRKWYIFLILLGFIALGLTLSRSAYLAFILGFIVVTAFRARWLLVGGLVSMFFMIMIVPGIFDRVSQGVSLDDSSQKHIESWETAWHLTQHYPVLGVGYNHLAVVQGNLGLLDEWDINNKSGFENSFLSVSVYAGFIGLFSFLLFWFFYILYSVKNVLKKENSRYSQGVSLGILGALIVCVLSSMLINTLFFAFIMIELWMMLGFLIYIDKKAK